MNKFLKINQKLARVVFSCFPAGPYFNVQKKAQQICLIEKRITQKQAFTNDRMHRCHSDVTLPVLRALATLRATPRLLPPARKPLNRDGALSLNHRVACGGHARGPDGDERVKKNV